MLTYPYVSHSIRNSNIVPKQIEGGTDPDLIRAKMDPDLIGSVQKWNYVGLSEIGKQNKLLLHDTIINILTDTNIPNPNSFTTIRLGYGCN